MITNLTPQQIAALSSFSTSDAKKSFILLTFDIYQRIPKNKWEALSFREENGIVQMQVEGKTVFLLHKLEAGTAQQAIKVCAKSASREVLERIARCADVSFAKGTLFTELQNLFNHFLLNHPFPWRICADDESLLCAKNQVVVESKDVQLLKLIEVFSGTVVEKVKKNLSEVNCF